MKQLVLLLDGTWNSDGDSERLTNIVRLREMLEAEKRTKASNASAASAIEQRLYYDEGVGTAAREKLLGGIFGLGVSESVKQGYRFLSQFYSGGDQGDQDEIYIFGFSRGAFTARSLAGFVAASGLLRGECCDRGNFDRAWTYYRTSTRDRLPAEKASLEKLCTPNVRIHFLGVFDTVGALGVPLGGPLRSIGGSKFRFHDTNLGSSIDYAFQALSLDEHRGPFVPSLWTLPDHNRNVMVEQVWFPGAHSDIGGGYPGASSAMSLKASDAVLHWMLSRLKLTGLRLDYPELGKPPVGITELHDSVGWYTLSRRRPMFRLVDRARFPEARRFFAVKGPAKPMNEKVHASALQLFGRPVTIGGREKMYRPANLEAAFPAIASGALRVVDFDGGDLPVSEAVAMVALAQKRAKSSRAAPAPVGTRLLAETRS